MSQAAQLQNAPDLRKAFPRSPGETLGPYILLPRILDKCRAGLAGTNGEYNFNCPLDRRFFDFTEIDADAFKAEVAQGKTDEEMLAWVRQNSKNKTDEEIGAWAYENRTARPDTPERRAYFEKMRMQNCPGNPYVETWFQLLDAEEGRFLCK